MGLLELVKRRYSCRNYQPTSVEQEKLADEPKDKKRKAIEEIVK